MALNVEMVTFDCSDPARLAGWWGAQFDGTTQELIPGGFVAVTRPQGPRLRFQKVPEPTPGKNRVHLGRLPQQCASAGSVRRRRLEEAFRA